SRRGLYLMNRFLTSLFFTANVVISWLLNAANLAATEPPANGEDLKFFEAKVRPVLVARCVKCHGAAQQKGKLRLDSREAVLAGGESGPAVVSGKPAE